MKNRILSLAVLSLLISSIYSCSKEKQFEVAEKQEEIPASILTQIKKLGFSTNEVQKIENGYLVEGDILLTEENLKEAATSVNLNIAKAEQYRTTNLVVINGQSRTITISVNGLGAKFSEALDTTIKRYNNLGLKLKFQRATTGTTGTIDIKGVYWAPVGNSIRLGRAGFPTILGDPFHEILFNTHPQGYSSQSVNKIVELLQHEIGHAIGFRHTDYSDRGYSCGKFENEGQGNNGAILIPGTPSGPDSESFMLACVGSSPRTFNANDIIALNYLYK